MWKLYRLKADLRDVSRDEMSGIKEPAPVFGMKSQIGFSERNEATAQSSCSFSLLWVVCVSALLIPRGCCCCCWPIGSWDSFFFSKGWEQMKWWDSCNFWMTPSWQRQSPSIVPSHYSLLLCRGAFCSFCWFLCWTLCLQVRPSKLLYFNTCSDNTPCAQSAFAISCLFVFIILKLNVEVMALCVFFFSFLFFSPSMPFYYSNVHADVSGQYLFLSFHQGLILVYLKLDEIAFSFVFTRSWTSITSIGRSGHMVR